MKTKIKTIRIFGKEETLCYSVGDILNNLKVHTIKDMTLEYEDSIHFFYIGKTKEDEVVFEIIDAPMIIEYEPKPNLKLQKDSE